MSDLRFFFFFFQLLVLVGPTASGKTPISLSIAERLNGEIISADSRQVYKFMDIGTAKPTRDERKRVRHYFVDEILPDREFNAGEFGKKGRLIIDEIIQRGKTPIVVGGSGLYIQALVDGFFDGPSADQTIRHQLTQRMKEIGAEKLLEELKRIDPIAAASMLPSNTRRIIRALEVYKITGMPISELHKSRFTINFSAVFVGLHWERQELYERINRRVDYMLEKGLIDEVKNLQERGYSSGLNALQTVGYKEVFDYLQGKNNYMRMVELIKQNSRRYAKRQLTWFKRDKRIKWFDVQSDKNFPLVAASICEYFNKLRQQF
ncbi:MAG: tRNA (adenosine(37)-N6)-dimethylallyltransferase MiaA [Ignavibacteriales bacterium]|nr:tRNA (adenosine(37)-N6)-dimethylallyltransferase MiaA [Ignavibacteriales bacterium]